MTYPISLIAVADALAEQLGLPPQAVASSLRYWSTRAPFRAQERDDVVSEICVKSLEHRPPTPGLFDFVAGRTATRWVERDRRWSINHVELENDLPVHAPGRDPAEVAAGRLDAARVIRTLPPTVIRLAHLRSDGYALSSADRQRLSRWRRSEPVSINIDV